MCSSDLFPQPSDADVNAGLEQLKKNLGGEDAYQKRLKETHRITLDYDDALLNEVAARCTEVESGARNVDNILSNTMLPDLSRQILGRLAEGTSANRVQVSVGGGELTYAWDSELVEA